MEIWKEWRKQVSKRSFSKFSLLFHPLRLISKISSGKPWDIWKGIFVSADLKDDDVITWDKKLKLDFTFETPVTKLYSYFVTKKKSQFLQNFEEIRSQIDTTKCLFQVNEVCQLVGLLPFKFNSNKVDLRESATPFIDFILSKLDSSNENCIYSKALEKINNNKVVVRGGMSAILNSLITMSTPAPSRFSYDQLLEGVENRIQFIKLPYLGSVRNLDIRSVRINPTSYSGFISSLLGGYSRADSYPFSFQVAEVLFDKIRDDLCYCLGLWTYGTRPKAAELTQEKNELKARPIALCDNVLNIVNSAVSQKIFEHLNLLPYSELFVGKSLKVSEIKYLESNFADDHRCIYFSPDWSSFDNHVYEELIVISFLLLKSCFGASIKSRNLFFFCMTSFIDKFIIIDPGFIIKVMKGIPSGHPFTSLVGTLVNWVLWSTIFNEYCKRTGDKLDDRWRVIVSGDDAMIRVPIDVDEDILFQIVQESGMKCDDFRGLGTGFWSSEIYKGAHLLRRYFYRDYTYIWDEAHLYNKLMYSEKLNPSLVTLLNQVCDYLVIMPHRGSLEQILSEYVYYLWDLIINKQSEEGKEIARKFAEVYSLTQKDKISMRRLLLDVLPVNSIISEDNAPRTVILYNRNKLVANRYWYFTGLKHLVKMIRNKYILGNLDDLRKQYNYIWKQKLIKC